MSFVNPILLWALGFLTVPILILFFINRKKIILHWAAYEWMRRAVVTKRKRTKITEWLKLISKLLLILFLVLFAVRPVSRSGGAGNSLIVVDHTLSMAALLEEGTRLDRARDLCAQFLLRSEFPTAVYAFDGQLTPLSKLAQRSAAAHSLLRGLEISPRAATLKQLTDALAGSQALDGIDTVFVVSDFQKSSYREPKALVELTERVGRGRNVVFVPVDTRAEVPNVSIESVAFRPEGFWPGVRSRLAVRVRNRSALPVERLPVTCLVDGQKTDRSLVSLPAYGEKEVDLNLFAPDARSHTVTIDLPPDSFPPDNTYHFVLTPGDAVRVLSVCREPAPGEPFELDLFFRSALRSFLAEDYLVYRRVRPAEFLAEKLEASDVILSFGVPYGTGGPLPERFGTYLAQGGRLISWCDAADEKFWAGLAGAPVALHDQAAAPDPDRLVPGYLAFMKEGDLNPNLVSFYRYASIPLPERSDEGRLYVAGVKDPLIAVRRVGAGSATLAGFLPYPHYTDFFNNPNFIQFTMRLFTESLGRPVMQVRDGEEIRAIPAERGRPAAGVVLRTDAGRVQKVGSRTQGERTFYDVDPLPEPAFCTLARGDETLARFGYNVTRDDSDIEPAPRTVFQDAVKAGLIYDSQRTFGGAKVRRERLWLPFSLLLLAIAFELYAHLVRKR